MASSLNFNPNVKSIIPVNVLERLRVIPFNMNKDPMDGTKLCLIARKPLDDNALFELKSLTGIINYEIQLVGEDVLDAYIYKYKNGKLFNTYN